MFTWLFRTKVTETGDADRRNRIQDIFREQQIDYVIKCKDENKRNAMDGAMLGESAKPKLVYSFWVKKEQEKAALAALGEVS